MESDGSAGSRIIGRESELARVKSFIGSVPEGPSALLLEGTAGIGKTTLWHAALFISVKTVEANLSRIFHKLGVRSRTELTRRIATTHGQRVSPDSSPLHRT